MRTYLPMVSLIENLMTKQNIGSYISITAIDEFWMSSVLSRLKMNQWERYRKCSIMRLQRPWKWSVNEEKRVALCLNDCGENALVTVIGFWHEYYSQPLSKSDNWKARLILSPFCLDGKKSSECFGRWIFFYDKIASFYYS